MLNADQSTKKPRDVRPAPRAGWAVAVGRIVLGVLLASSVLTVHAQTANALSRIPIADPNAPLVFRPSVTQLPSGAAQVNITAPNAAGVSLNQYQRFDVPAAGVVLNNSATGGTALVGAGVTGNSNLKNGAASTIVNEVTVAGPPSFLAGTIEVFGAPAAVIVANPWGVTCQSCGVVNTPRLTFATGTPQPQNAQGQASAWADANRIAWDIKGGQIRILDNGVEGTVGRLDLLGQSVLIDGPLRAHYLNQDLSSINLAAGTQGFSLQPDGNWGPGSAAPATNGGLVPASNGMAIDATVFGAMTAGQIRVVSTDAGMGVNLRGPLNAYQQGIQISSNGSLSVGDASAVQNITLSANGNLSTNNLSAGNRIDAASGGAMQLGGTTRAAGSIALQSGGEMAIATTPGGKLATPGALQATAAGNVQLGVPGAQISVGQDATVRGAGVSQLGALDVGHKLALQAERELHIAGTVHSGGDITASAGESAMVSGTLSSSTNLALTARDINIPGTLQVANEATLAASKNLNLSGTALVGDQLTLAADTLALSGKISARQSNISGSEIVLGAGGAAAQISGGLNLNMARSIDVQGALDVTGNALFTSGTDTTLAGPVNVSGAFGVNAGGIANVAGTVSANASALTGTISRSLARAFRRAFRSAHSSKDARALFVDAGYQSDEARW